jgi:hypothetical protein
MQKEPRFSGLLQSFCTLLGKLKVCTAIELEFWNLKGSTGAIIPPTTENELKVARDVSFQNTTMHSSGQLISMPPDEPDYAQWELSQRMKDELGLVCEGIFGEKGREFYLQNYRICW